MQMLNNFAVFWAVCCISTIYGFVINATSGTTLNGVLQDSSIADQGVKFGIVSISNEMAVLGRDPQTLCPFRVENRTVDQNHTLGNLVVEISEIVCSGSCSAQSCADAGSTCKQLVTDLRLAINNPATGLPETVILTNVAIGCSCTPDDPGVLGEEVLRR